MVNGMNDVYYSARAIKELLADKDFIFSKSKGQNFLIDPNIPEKIVRLSGVDKSSGVLEVGPGFGALTNHLCRIAGHVTAIELDTKLYAILSKIFSQQTNVDLIQGDILKIDIAKIVKEKMPDLIVEISKINGDPFTVV